MASTTSTTQNNHFQNVISDVQAVPQDRRTEALIDGIAEQMEVSGNQQAQQLAKELESVKPQLVQACQARAA